MTHKEVKKILDCAWEHDRDIVPYFALAIFAGLRPSAAKGSSEITKLQWEDVWWEGGIRIGENFDTKTQTKRFVEISDNLKRWLAPWRNAKGSVCPPNTRERVENVKFGKHQSKKGTPRKEWRRLMDERPSYHDITRHTYWSFHLALHRNENETILNMGHAKRRTFREHYLNVQTKADAERFWAIVPPDGMD